MALIASNNRLVAYSRDSSKLGAEASTVLDASTMDSLRSLNGNQPVYRIDQANQRIELAVPFGIGDTDARAYWSESWIDHTHVLGEIVGVVRAARPAPVVEVDEGWRPDRDFSIGVGRWGWLHVQALVEEHAQGKCLMRVRSRLRVSGIGTLQALTMALVLIGATLLLMSVHWRTGSAIGSLALSLLATRIAWQTTHAVAVFDRALARVIQTSGMISLPQNRPGSAPAAAPPLAADAHAARGA